MKLHIAIAVALCSLLFEPSLAQTPAPSSPLQPMSFFIGSWLCDGIFPSSGKTITSTMRFRYDLEGTSIVKHHDDTSPPALYHAIELWGYSAVDKHFNAAIQDNFGGVRDLTSPGWDGDTLVWTTANTIRPFQQFAYRKVLGDSFTVDWRVSRDGVAYTVGDTLTCTRQKSLGV